METLYELLWKLQTTFCSLFTDIPQGYPRITENPQLQNIQKGQTAKMMCSAEADSMDQPNIYWLKNELPVDLTDDRISVNKNGKTGI